MRTLFFLLFLGYLMVSCKGRSENVAGQFTIEVPVDIGAGLPPTKTHYFLHRNVGIKFIDYLKTLGLTTEEVLRVEPASAILTPVADDVRWNFVDHGTIYVFSPDSPEEQLLSFRTDFIPLNVGERLNIFPFMVDLKRLFLAPSIGLRTGLHFRGASPRTIQSVLQLKFNVIVD